MAEAYPQIHPPRLEIEVEIPSICFKLFKTTFVSYQGNHEISNGDALILLKEKSIPAGPLHELISTSETLQEAFELLDTQFGSPLDEIPILKSKIIDKEILSLDYTIESIL